MIKKSGSSNTSGKLAEDIAADYLKKKKITLLNRNFHSRFGEIDIIAEDDGHIAFIEVRYRKNEDYLAVIETVDQYKCKKLVTTSEHYLNRHKKYRSYIHRFDVITITGKLENPVIEWIKNAF